ncbi:MAG TPA: hypothetical protein VL443_18225 [Cyclobacteriaceae bacterium]|jgi:hypothetical protein|nr:hypothetical protein [Cyclobacteriaceae bacterium]
MVSINKIEEDSEEPLTIEVKENVEKYVQGVRASSDLGSRKRREEALEVELTDVWGE